jgi:hypothetical protein
VVRQIREERSGTDFGGRAELRLVEYRWLRFVVRCSSFVTNHGPRTTNRLGELLSLIAKQLVVRRSSFVTNHRPRTTNRSAALLLLLAIPVFAQQPVPADPLAAREALSQKRATEWETLAKSLEAKISRMLPCDARVRGSIEEVSRASQARLASLSDYLQAAGAQAKADAERALKASTDSAIAAKEAGVELTEAEQQRAAIDGQLADLKESTQRRPALNEATAKLAGIQSITMAQIARLQQEAARRAALGGSLTDLATAYQARQAAIDAELAALVEETARWVDYYAARLARADTECSITNRSRAPQRKKQ